MTTEVSVRLSAATELTTGIAVLLAGPAYESI